MNTRILSRLLLSGLRLLLLTTWVLGLWLPGETRLDIGTAYAGTGPTLNILQGGGESTMDGRCIEYSLYSYVQIVVPLEFTVYTFKVYYKHTADYLYFCFNNPYYSPDGPSDVKVYVDRDDDGGAADGNDFVIFIQPDGNPGAAYWNPATSAFNGPDPGGWSAVSRTYTVLGQVRWDAEFQISRHTMGGWKHTAGLSLVHHYVDASGFDFTSSWPNSSSEMDPASWGNASLKTGEVTIGQSDVVPTVDGNCPATSGFEYADAASVSFSSALAAITAYVKHTSTDLYVCMAGLAVPAIALQSSRNAVVYINRAGTGGDSPGPDDMAFTISYSGIVSVHRGSGSGFDGPDPGGYSIARATVGGELPQWSAEFRISGATLGGGWARDIDITFAEQEVNATGDYAGWPGGSRWNIPNTWGVGHLTTSPLPAGADMRPTAIEVTQSVQDINNSVVLVASKRTFARVHVASNANRTGVTARLLGFRNSIPLGVLTPINPGGVINVVTSPDRAQLNDSFLFELPANWIVPGTITLEAEINPFHGIREDNYDNNTVTTGDLTFRATNPLILRDVNYEYFQSNGALVSAPTFDQDMLESQLRRMYPISSLSVLRRTLIHFGPFVGFTNQFPFITIDDQPNAVIVIAELLALRSIVEPANLAAVYYGMVYDRGDMSGFMRGMGFGFPIGTAAGPTGPSSWRWDFDGSYGDWYGSHEIGHALWRFHTDACNTDGPYQSYPYPNGIIGGPDGNTSRFFGFDVGVGVANLPIRVMPGDTWTDIMSYCDNEWISDVTYTGIRDYLQIGWPLAPGHSDRNIAALNIRSSQPYTTGDFLAVYGVINFTDQVAALPYLSRQSQVSQIPPLIAGPYHIRLLNASHVQLADYAFTPLANSEDTNLTAKTGVIAQTVNFMPGTRRVAIFSDVVNREIASVNVSANAPTVTITARSGGPSLAASQPVTLTWHGADLDGDALRYTLLYSFNGRTTWRALASGIASTTIAVDSGQLEGTSGASTGYFRVVANDGVLTSSADSDSFGVAGKAPLVAIDNPAHGSVYAYGQTVALEGYGQDFEDGTLGDAYLSWSSSLDGPLGIGHLLHTSLLSVGTHAITLTATDSNGLTGGATVVINIAADVPQPNPMLSVAPDSLLFLVQPGGPNPGPHTLSIRNLGTGSINWTATSDATWATLSSASGTAPSDVTVNVDARALPGGPTRVAHIVITGAGASNSPQLITVVAQNVTGQASIYLPLVIKE